MTYVYMYMHMGTESDQLWGCSVRGEGGGVEGRVNGGETHVVLCLTLNMWSEQDTEILLRSRRR